MATGPLIWNKILVGRVRVSKWGWLMVMGPLSSKKTVAGEVRMFHCGWLMAMGPLNRTRFWLGWSGCLSGHG